MFKARLQRGNRVQVPRIVRWRYKLEGDQALKVSLTPLGFFASWESYYARMDKSGRISVPKLTIALFLRHLREGERSLDGAVMEVMLEPV